MSSRLRNRSLEMRNAIKAQTNEGQELLAAGALVDAMLGSRGHVRGVVIMTGVGVDADTVTILDDVYHLRNGTATPAGQVDVDITGGQTADEVCTALALAINGQSGVAAIEDLTDDTVTYTSLFELEVNQPAPTAAESLTNGTIEQATSTASTWAEVHSATITAQDLEDDVLRVHLDNTITTVDHLQCTIQPASGAASGFLDQVNTTGTTGRWLFINFADTVLLLGARLIVVVHYS